MLEQTLNRWLKPRDINLESEQEVLPTPTVDLSELEKLGDAELVAMQRSTKSGVLAFNQSLVLPPEKNALL